MGGKSVEKTGQKIVAVCGVKNSGKTTLLAELVKELTARGKLAAVIKHDGHDFSCDIPGTDSFLLKEAGAYGTAVFSDSRIFIHNMIILSFLLSAPYTSGPTSYRKRILKIITPIQAS